MRRGPSITILLMAGLGFSQLPVSAADLDLATCREMAQKTYIAYYGRPADLPGLDYWAGRLCDEGGWSDHLIDSFGTSEEYQVVFGSFSDEDMIDAFYLQLFGRMPDPAGKAFYLDLLGTGQSTLPQIALDIVNGAQGGDLDITLLRDDSADYFTFNHVWSEFGYTLDTRDAVSSILVSVTDQPTLEESEAMYRDLLEGVYPPPPATTPVVDPWDAYDMTLAGGQLRYAPMSPEARNVEVGDIVITHPQFDDAGGQALRVEAVADDGVYKVLTTNPATFEEAVAGALTEGTVAVSATLEYDQLQAATTADGVAISAGAPVSVPGGEATPVRIDFDIPLPIQGVSGRVKGYLSFLPEVQFDLAMTNGVAGDIAFGVRLRKDEALVVDALGGTNLDWQQELLTASFQAVEFRVGGVPVYLTPTLTVTASADGTLNGDASFGVQRTGFDYTYGVAVDAAGTVMVVEEEGTDPAVAPDGLAVMSAYDLTADLQEQGDVTLYAAPGLDFLASGAVDGQANFTPGVETCVDVAARGTESVGLAAAGLARLGADFDAVVRDRELYAEQFCGAVSEAFLMGSAVDAATNDPLDDVEVRVSDGAGTEVARGITGSDGLFQFRIPSDVVLYTNFESVEHVGAYYYLGVVPSGDSFSIERVRLIPLDLSGPGTIAGRVVDATNGLGVSGAQVFLRDGINVTAGTLVAEEVADTAGNFTIDGVQAGNYSLQGSAEGFLDGFATALAFGGSTEFTDVTVSPLLPEGQWRIVLTWGEIPSDLDSHLTGPDSSGGRFHVYWLEPLSEFVDLDVDDVTSYGPETITIREQLDGLYRYSVHDYTNLDSNSSTQLGASGAKVEIYRGADRVGIYFVPNAAGTLWTVFELQGNQIFPINRMSYESDPVSITSATGGSDADLIAEIPAKK